MELLKKGIGNMETHLATSYPKGTFNTQKELQAHGPDCSAKSSSNIIGKLLGKPILQVKCYLTFLLKYN